MIITKHIKIKGKITHFATNLLILQQLLKSLGNLENGLARKFAFRLDIERLTGKQLARQRDN